MHLSVKTTAAAALATASLFVLAIATAISSTADPLTELLPPVKDSEACWERVYSRDHLKSHPEQQVTAIRFSLAYRQYEADLPAEYYFDLDATTRSHPRPMGNGGLCSMGDNGAVCGIDCDGGGVVVRPGKKDGTILVDLEAFGYISLSSGCGAEEGEFFSLEAEPDDKVFLLHRKSADHCATVFGSM